MSMVLVFFFGEVIVDFVIESMNSDRIEMRKMIHVMTLLCVYNNCILGTCNVNPGIFTLDRTR